MRKKVDPKILVVISDTHCGSKVGLLPPGISDQDGNELKQNLYQQWLWECWLDATGDYFRRIVGDEPFVLLLNGDLVEGNHHGTKQAYPDNLDHTAIALNAIRPVASKASMTHIVLGTECHTHSMESGIGAALTKGDEKEPRCTVSTCKDTGKHAHARITFKVNGCLVSATHHCSATSRPWLESGEYGRALHSERGECLRAGWDVPQLLIRAHRHRAGFFTDYSAGLLITGAWQGLTRHGHKAVPGAVSEPSIAICDWRGCDEGELPVVRQRVYAPPAPEVL
jgi:hypothetical protein